MSSSSESGVTPREQLKNYATEVIKGLEEMVAVAKTNVKEKGIVGAASDSINSAIENATKVIQETRQNMKDEKDLSKLQQAIVPLISIYDKVSEEVPKQMNNVSEKYSEIKKRQAANIEKIKEFMKTPMTTIATNVRDAALKTVEKAEELDEQYGVKKQAGDIILNCCDELDRHFKVYKRAKVIDNYYHISDCCKFVQNKCDDINHSCYGIPGMIFSIWVFIWAIVIILMKKVFDMCYEKLQPIINERKHHISDVDSENTGDVIIIVEDVEEPYIYFWNCSPTVCPNFPGVKLTTNNGIAQYKLDVSKCSVIISNKTVKSDEYQITEPGTYRYKEDKWIKEN